MSKNPKTTVRFKNVRIDLVSTSSFPEMVQIVKTPTSLKKLNGKKFVNLEKAKIAIEYEQTIKLIGKVVSEPKFIVPNYIGKELKKEFDLSE